MFGELEDAAWQERWCLGLRLGFNDTPHVLQDGLSRLLQAAGKGLMLNKDHLCSSSLRQGDRSTPHTAKLQNTAAVSHALCGSLVTCPCILPVLG